MNLVNIFDYLYYKAHNKVFALNKVRINSVLRHLIRTLANAVIPFVFLVSKKASLPYRSEDKLLKHPEIIVSLTSFPGRINRIWITLESILRQKVQPDRIILWLSREQFTSLYELPKRLLEMQNRGVEIYLCSGDLRSHKKYYYSLKKFPQSVIITVDDDVLYNNRTIRDLIISHKKYPHAVICNHAVSIGEKEGSLLPYHDWEHFRTPSTPQSKLMPIGVGGVLYPPGCLSGEVLNEKVFSQICLYADDIWLNAMTRLKGTYIAKTDYYSSYLPVLHKSKQSLHNFNNVELQNDKQIQAVQQYCLEKFGKDPFLSNAYK